jgi:subtilase family serine protease
MSRKFSSLILVSLLVWLTSTTNGLAQTTGSKTLKGNHPALADQIPATGNADPQLPLTMRITLSLSNRAALDQLVHDQQDPASPRYHQWLSAAEFNQSFGPSAAQTSEVSSWLAAQGFHVTRTSLAMRSVSFSGTAATAVRAFQTSIKTFNGGASYANISDPVIPSRFAGTIARIDGLDNIHSFIPVVEHPKSNANQVAQLDSLSDSIGTGDDQNLASDVQIGASPEAKTAHGDYFGPDDFYSFYDETPLRAVGINGGPDDGDCIGITGVSDFSDKAIKAFNSRFNLPRRALHESRSMPPIQDLIQPNPKL